MKKEQEVFLKKLMQLHQPWTIGELEISDCAVGDILNSMGYPEVSEDSYTVMISIVLKAIQKAKSEA